MTIVFFGRYSHCFKRDTLRNGATTPLSVVPHKAGCAHQFSPTSTWTDWTNTSNRCSFPLIIGPRKDVITGHTTILPNNLNNPQKKPLLKCQSGQRVKSHFRTSQVSKGNYSTGPGSDYSWI